MEGLILQFDMCKLFGCELALNMVVYMTRRYVCLQVERNQA